MIADIVKIDAPSQAVSGDTVIVDVSVKNLGLAPAGYNHIAVTGVYDSISLSWQFDYLYLAPQETVVFRGWFTMPDKNVRVTVSSWYWDGSKWVLDETEYLDIALAAVGFSEFAVASFSKA